MALTPYQLSLKNGSNSVLVAANGVFIVNDTNLYSSNFSGFLVLEDSVISSLKHTGDATEQINEYVSNSGTAIKAGAIITPVQQKTFGSIQLTSGSVQIIL
jgi:hypothetical protein